MEFSTARKLQSALVPLSVERAVSSLAVQSLLGGADRLGFIDRIVADDPGQIETRKNVLYGPDKNHKLDIYRPSDRASRGTVVYVHGGGFRILSKQSHSSMARLLARAGFTVFNLDYRLAPEHPYPAAPEDVTRAIRYLADRGDGFGFDGDRLALVGESSGANVITAVAAAMCFEPSSIEASDPWARHAFSLGLRPSAVVPVCGFLQVSDPGRLDRGGRLSAFTRDKIIEASQAYLPDRREETTDTPILADPLRVFEASESPSRELPPFFTAVGTSDPLLDDTRRLERALRRHGATVRATYYERELHAFHAFYWRTAARGFWRNCIEFLNESLGNNDSRGTSPAHGDLTDEELSKQGFEEMVAA
jgi:acetyl esterase